MYIVRSFGHFHQKLSATKKSRLFYLELFQTLTYKGEKQTHIYLDIVLYRK